MKCKICGKQFKALIWHKEAGREGVCFTCDFITTQIARFEKEMNEVLEDKNCKARVKIKYEIIRE